jgi:hypothetical protein
MPYSLILILAFLSQTFSSMAIANRDSPENKQNQCQGLTQEATNVARELFRKNRPPNSLREYKMTTEDKGREIVVRFARRSSQRLGDHPFVVYDCEKRAGRYFEGE